MALLNGKLVKGESRATIADMCALLKQWEAEGYTVVIEEGQPPGGRPMTKRLKRPRDPIELGKLIGDILTGQVEDLGIAKPPWSSWTIWPRVSPIGCS